MNVSYLHILKEILPGQMKALAMFNVFDAPESSSVIGMFRCEEAP